MNLNLKVNKYFQQKIKLFLMCYIMVKDNQKKSKALKKSHF